MGTITKQRIFLSSPHMSEQGYEKQFIKEAFDTNWIAPLGKNVNEFEKELAATVGAKDAAALSSGTAAIHLALKAAGVGEGEDGTAHCHSQINSFHSVHTTFRLDRARSCDRAESHCEHRCSDQARNHYLSWCDY